VLPNPASTQTGLSPEGKRREKSWLATGKDCFGLNAAPAIEAHVWRVNLERREFHYE